LKTLLQMLKMQCCEIFGVEMPQFPPLVARLNKSISVPFELTVTQVTAHNATPQKSEHIYIFSCGSACT